MNNHKNNDRCIRCELQDALQDFTLNTIVLASAKLICENEKTFVTKHTEDCKLALTAVSSTAPEGCGDSALLQVCIAAITCCYDYLQSVIDLEK